MTDIMAAIGLAQIKRYAGLIERRKEIISRYNEALENYNVSVLDHSNSSGHLYLVRFLDQGEDYRNAFINRMAELGVACNVHYKPLPLLTAYKNLRFNIKDYPNAYNMYHNEVTLPLHTCLSDEDVDYVIECVHQVIGEMKNV